MASPSKRRLAVSTLMVLTATAAQPTTHAVAAQPPTYSLRAVAGGLGELDPLKVSVWPVSVTAHGTDVYVLDDRDGYSLVRQLDTATGTTRVVLGDGATRNLTKATGPSYGLPGPGRDYALSDPSSSNASAGPAGLIGAASDGRLLISGGVGATPRRLWPNGRIRLVRGFSSEYTDEVSAPNGDMWWTASGQLVHAPEGADRQTVLQGAGSTPHGSCPEGTDPPASTLEGNPMAFSTAGTVYLAGPNCVVKYDEGSHSLVRVAGKQGLTTSSGDGGQAVDAGLSRIRALALDSSGDLLIGTDDNPGGRLRMVAPDGTISTVASQSDLAIAGITTVGSTVYLADDGASQVRAVTSVALGGDGVLRRVMGTGSDISLAADGEPADHAQLDPTCTATAADGTRYVASSGEGVVRRIDPAGVVHHLAGPGLGPISDCALDPDGDVLVVAKAAARRIDHTTGVVTTIAGAGAGQADDNVAATSTNASFSSLAMAPTGDLYLGGVPSGGGTQYVYRVGTDGTIHRVTSAGNPNGLAVTGSGDLLVTDGSQLKRITAPATAPVVTVVAGSSTPSCTPATTTASAAGASLPLLYDIVIAPGGDVFLSGQSSVFVVHPDLTLDRVAGTPCKVGTSDGRVGGLLALLGPAPTLSLDSDGAPLLTDAGARRLYRVTKDSALLAPTEVVVHPGNRELTVTWTNPVPSPDQSPATAVSVTLDDGRTTTVYGDQALARLRGLVNGHTYTATVAAVNGAGTSPAGTAQGTPAAGPPSSPQRVQSIASTNGVEVHWLPPADSGGAALTGYTISADGRSVHVAPTITHGILPGFGNGAAVTPQVTADGPGGSSAPASGQPVTTVPGVGYAVTTPVHRADAFVVRASQPIRDVDPNDISWRDPHGTRLGTVVSCSRNGSPVNCQLDVVDAFAVRPTTALTAGAPYTVELQPAGDPYPMQDLPGSAIPRFQTTFRADPVVDDVATTQAWQPVSDSAAYGGSYRRDNLAGASTSATFTGTTVSWWATHGPTGGGAGVYIDGTLVSTPDTYAPSTVRKVRHTYTTKAGTHRITVQVRGTHSSASKGTDVMDDGFSQGTGAPALVETFSLARPRPSGAVGGTVSSGRLSGESFTTRVWGSLVDLRFLRGRTEGIGHVVVDGKTVLTFNDVSISTGFVTRRVTFSSAGAHTVQIVIDGKRAAGGTDARISLDQAVAR